MELVSFLWTSEQWFHVPIIWQIYWPFWFFTHFFMSLIFICSVISMEADIIFNSSLSSEEEMDFFLIFLATLCGMSGLGSLTRNPTPVPWSGSMESQPLDCQGISWVIFFKSLASARYMCSCSVSKSCPTLCDPVDYSPPGSSDHGILQGRTLEWVATSSSTGFSWPRDWTHVSCTGRQILYHRVT